MPTLWYAVDESEFPYFVPFRTPLRELAEHSRARVAELCAEEYHENQDGRTSGWPIVIELKCVLQTRTTDERNLVRLSPSGS